MRLTAKNPQVGPSDPIRLSASLHVREAPVCLAAGYDFQVEMRRKDGNSVVRSPSKFICGTPFMATIFLYPLVYPVCLLDVGDAFGRFDVIREAAERTHLLEVTRDSSRLYVTVDGSPTGGLKPDPAWAPGKYAVRVKLTDTEPVFYPAPLFWKPYSHPVEAEIEIEVKENIQP